MIAWTRETTYWGPMLLVLAAALAVVAQHSGAQFLPAMMGLVNGPALFAKIERFRRHGLDVETAADLAAEQSGEDPQELAVAHFAWLIDNHDAEPEAPLQREGSC